MPHSAFQAGLQNYEVGSQMPSLMALHRLVAHQVGFETLALASGL